MDLHDLHHNTRGGLHRACLASTWDGLGGLRRRGEQLHLAPALPTGITRVAFRARGHDRPLLVEVTPKTARRHLADITVEPVRLYLYDEAVEVSTTAIERATRARTPLLSIPAQPPGRAPLR